MFGGYLTYRDFFFFQDNAATNSTDNAHDDSGELWKTRMREVRLKQKL